MFSGFLDLPWWGYIAYTLIVTHITIAAVTVFLHRHQAHRALDLHPLVSHFFRFWLWLTTGMRTKEWTAIHRKHHAFTDEEGDPHSPQLKGFWSVQFGNVFHYIKEARNQETIKLYSKDIKDDWWERYFFQHGLLGLMTGIIVLCYVLGIGWGLLAAGIHAVTYVFVLSSSVNGLCHYVGYKNFDNTATNIRLVAFVTAGEGLHNNHHEHRHSPKFSARRGEFDPAWLVIKLMIVLGLAKRKRIIEEIEAIKKN